jgi:hypothetical protein
MISIPANVQATPGLDSSTSLLASTTGYVINLQIATDTNGNAVAVWQLLYSGPSSIYANHLSAGIWGTATKIDAGTGDAYFPQVAMDNKGNAIAAWQQIDSSGHSSIYANRYSAGVWGTAKLLDTATGEAGSPQIAVDSSGNAIVVWVQNLSDSQSPFDTFARRFTAGVWGAVDRLSYGYDDASDPHIAMDNNGHAIAVWVQSDLIYAAKLSAGAWSSSGLWSDSSPIELFVGVASYPNVVMDSNGNALVVWVQAWYVPGNQGNTAIFASRFISGVWGTPILLDLERQYHPNIFEYGSPQVAMDSKGDAMVTWLERDTLDYSSSYAIRYSAGAWGARTTLSNDIWDSYPIPLVAMDSNGNAVVIWGHTDPMENSIIYASRSTPSGVWGPSVILQSGAEPAKIAMDGNGNAIAFYVQDDNLHARRFLPAAWGTATLLESGTGDASTPQVAMNANGKGMTVWQQYDGAHYSIYARSYSSGTWGTAKLIETGSGNADSPQVAMDNIGNAVAVWRQYDGAHYSIYTNRYSVGAWGTAKLLETSNGDAQTPQIAMDDLGNAIAVWVQLDNVYRLSIYASNYTSALGWGPIKLLETSNVDASSPQVTMDGNGNAMTVWEQAGSIYANSYSPRFYPPSGIGYGGTWGTAKLVEVSTDWAIRPQIAMDKNGIAIAVWAQAGNLYANRYYAGAWGTAKLLETSSGWAMNPQIAMDNNGNAVAIWAQAGSIYANQYSLGAWGTAKLLETGAKDAFVPQVAMDGYGNALTVWQQNDGSHLSIYYNIFEGGGMR